MIPSTEQILTGRATSHGMYAAQPTLAASQDAEC